MGFILPLDMCPTRGSLVLSQRNSAIGKTSWFWGFAGCFFPNSGKLGSRIVNLPLMQLFYAFPPSFCPGPAPASPEAAPAPPTAAPAPAAAVPAAPAPPAVPEGQTLWDVGMSDGSENVGKPPKYLFPMYE